MPRSRKKIVMVTPSYSPNIGGVEKHVEHLVRELSISNEVQVFTLEHTISDVQTSDEANGIVVRRFRPRRISYGIEIPPSEMGCQIRSSNADIIHLHSLHALLPKYVRKAIQNLNSGFVVTPHYHGTGHTLLRSILFSLYKPTLSKVVSCAGAVICVSEFERSLLLRDFPSASSKSVVIPNAIDVFPDHLTSVSSREQGRMLYVGRLEKYKNVDKIVRALPLLSHKANFALVIIGKGPEQDRLAELARSLSVENRITFKSNLSKTELVEEYARSEFFIMPSTHEAYGMAVAEALAFDLKVIVADSSALSEFVRNGYALGISLPVTPQKIADEVMRYGSDNNNPHSTYQFITWQMVAAKTMSVYDSLLNANGVIARQ